MDDRVSRVTLRCESVDQSVPAHVLHPLLVPADSNHWSRPLETENDPFDCRREEWKINNSQRLDTYFSTKNNARWNKNEHKGTDITRVSAGMSNLKSQWQCRVCSVSGGFCKVRAFHCDTESVVQPFWLTMRGLAARNNYPPVPRECCSRDCGERTPDTVSEKTKEAIKAQISWYWPRDYWRHFWLLFSLPFCSLWHNRHLNVRLEPAKVKVSPAWLHARSNLRRASSRIKCHRATQYFHIRRGGSANFSNVARAARSIASRVDNNLKNFLGTKTTGAVLTLTEAGSYLHWRRKSEKKPERKCWKWLQA